MKTILSILLILAGLVPAVPARAQIVGPVGHGELPACPDSGGNHLNYVPATGMFSCGTSDGNPATLTGVTAGTGLAGGGTSGMVTLSLGAIANDSVLGNVGGGSAAPGALSAAQLTALMQPFTAGLSGAVPASGGGTANYLRADGTWAAPPGGGSVAPTEVQRAYGRSSSGSITVTMPQATTVGNTVVAIGYGGSAAPNFNGSQTVFLDRSSLSAVSFVVMAAPVTSAQTSITVNGTSGNYDIELVEVSGLRNMYVTEGTNYSGNPETAPTFAPAGCAYYGMYGSGNAIAYQSATSGLSNVVQQGANASNNATFYNFSAASRGTMQTLTFSGSNGNVLSASIAFCG
ncbi:hypothetical protein [Nguyenibacter sp. L1]|uniref:hypothetical protein n=1 Tax=Nguyenibacter sp. L1 TaxID=3049350 RepID=UPI002B46E4CA|nr:hypothetical protein [Nguyenibacter sp. L1]WRH89471.1 hypothetical protein QN315_07735 [Nguyenibacter sp. L1]